MKKAKTAKPKTKYASLARWVGTVDEGYFLSLIEDDVSQLDVLLGTSDLTVLTYDFILPGTADVKINQVLFDRSTGEIIYVLVDQFDPFRTIGLTAAIIGAANWNRDILYATLEPHLRVALGGEYTDVSEMKLNTSTKVLIFVTKTLPDFAKKALEAINADLLVFEVKKVDVNGELLYVCFPAHHSFETVTNEPN